MTATSVALLLGIVGVVLVLVAFPVELLRARRTADATGRVPPRLLVLGLVLGVVLVASIVDIVATVVLQ